VNRPDQKDYYETLGLDETASPDEIKTAYRNLVFQYHPDKTGNDPVATEKMQEVNEAYDVLGNHEKKREYDYLRSHHVVGYNMYSQSQTYAEGQGTSAGSGIERIFEEFANGKDLYDKVRKPSLWERIKKSFSRWSAG
jgi:molecular chaperone DnaJ